MPAVEVHNLGVNWTAVLVVVVPVAVWGLVVGIGVFSGRWRTFTFLAAFPIGGIGLVFLYLAFTADIDTSQLGAGLEFVGLLLVGLALLAIGFFTGLVALFLDQRPWGDHGPDAQ